MIVILLDKMPKCCNECEVYDSHYEWCSIVGQRGRSSSFDPCTDRSAVCPIIDTDIDKKLEKIKKILDKMDPLNCIIDLKEVLNG